MAYALEINPTTFPPVKYQSISTILNIIVPLSVSIATILLLAMFFVGSFTLLTASGDAEQIKKAQGYFTFSVFGFTIVVAGYFLVKLIGLIVGIDLPL